MDNSKSVYCYMTWTMVLYKFITYLLLLLIILHAVRLANKNENNFCWHGTGQQLYHYPSLGGVYTWFVLTAFDGTTQGQYWSIQEGACGTAPALVWRTTRYQPRGPLAPPLLSWQLLDKSLWRLLVASGATHWHGACRIMMMMMMMTW